MTDSSQCAYNSVIGSKPHSLTFFFYGGLIDRTVNHCLHHGGFGGLVLHRDLLLLIRNRDTVKNISLENVYYHYFFTAENRPRSRDICRENSATFASMDVSKTPRSICNLLQKETVVLPLS